MHAYFTSVIRGNSHPLHLRDFNLQVLPFAVFAFSASLLTAQEETTITSRHTLESSSDE
jgi:hypothetical protein